MMSKRFGLRPIPRRLLRQSMSVRTPAADGGFNAAVTVTRVRYERANAAAFGDEHRATDDGAGVIYMDAAHSGGVFEIPAGSRIAIGGDDVVVVRSKRLCGTDGRVHHWELSVS